MDKNLQFIRRGKTGCLFASILAKNPEKIGWKRILNPTTLEIPEDANIVSFIFEGKDKEYVREWALMNGMYEDITSKNTIGLRIKTKEGVSRVQYFGKDSHAKTRQTPNAELLFCVKLPKKRYFKVGFKGVFCIILQRPPRTRYKQEVVVGIDTGSKFEGLTVKSEAHTLLNIQTEAKTDVKNKVENRSDLRRSRRGRKLRYRQPRFNRNRRKGFVAPSTKSRWDYKLSLLNWLMKMYPVSHVVVEDISATTLKGKHIWNKLFSPLQVGKNYFRSEVQKLGVEYSEYAGFETYTLRNRYGLKKNSSKSKKDFYTHCVDSWVLANEVIGGHTMVDNEIVIFLSPIRRYRRQLHRQNPSKGGVRSPYGSTRSLGLERGTLVKHPKWGFSLVSGTTKGRISLNNLENNKRLCQNAKKEDLKLLTNQKWNIKT